MPSPSDRAREWVHTYTRDMSREDLERLFTHDTREAYEFFARGLAADELTGLPWWKRDHAPVSTGLCRLHTEAAAGAARALRRRAGDRAARRHPVVSRLRDRFGSRSGRRSSRIALLLPVWADGTFALLLSLVLVNLLVLLEVAERLSLKGELEVAREIQLALLPRGTYTAADIEISGFTKPANTVGGDFYDVLPQADGRHRLDARQRRGEGKSRRVADGAVARGAPHLGRRAHAAGGAGRAIERADLPA